MLAYNFMGFQEGLPIVDAVQPVSGPFVITETFPAAPVAPTVLPMVSPPTPDTPSKPSISTPLLVIGGLFLLKLLSGSK